MILLVRLRLLCSALLCSPIPLPLCRSWLAKRCLGFFLSFPRASRAVFEPLEGALRAISADATLEMHCGVANLWHYSAEEGPVFGAEAWWWWTVDDLDGILGHGIERCMTIDVYIHVPVCWKFHGTDERMLARGVFEGVLIMRCRRGHTA